MKILDTKIITTREFDSPEEKYEWNYPKVYPCVECKKGMTKRGGEKDKHFYTCQKCGSIVHGVMRSDIDNHFEKTRNLKKQYVTIDNIKLKIV